MPLKLIAALEEPFVLERADEKYGTDGEPTRIVIRQATQSQHERRSNVFDEINQVFNRNREEGEMVLRSRWSMEELKRMEVYLTLAECNLLDHKGNPLFRFRSNGNHQVLDMSEREFAEAWGLLPPDIAEEIHEKVWEVNVSWANPMGR